MTKRLPCFMTSALAGAVLAACGGGSDGGNDGPSTGQFLDEPVSGLNYDDGEGNSGTTTSSGEFDFASGATVTFSIGNLTLGSGKPNSSTNIVTPATLAGDATNASNGQAIRIGQLLQSLEADGNRGDATIQISSTIRSAFSSGSSISIDQDLNGDGDTSEKGESGVSLSLSDLENLLGSENATVSVPNGQGGSEKINFGAALGRLVDDVTGGSVSEGNVVAKSAVQESLVTAIGKATSGNTQLTVVGDPANLSDRGQWGGLVLSGRGINNNGSEIESEAVPTGETRFFGGNDNQDSSGTLRYVVVAESGVPFRPDEEVQGITIEAAGNGTTLENVQVLGSNDDGIEWFGGDANLRNAVISGPQDDGLDFDEGIENVVEKAIVRQGPNTGDHGIEADNEGPGTDAKPKSTTDFVNVTLLGNGGDSGGLWRRGFGGNFVRGVMADDTVNNGQFADGCLEINDEVDNNMAMRDVVFFCDSGEGNTADYVSEGLASQFFDSQQDESGSVSSARRNFQEPSSITLDSNTLALNSPNAGSRSDSPLSTSANSDNNPLPDNDYLGAVDPSAANADGNPSTSGPFWDGWTYIDPKNSEGALPMASSNVSIDTNGDGSSEKIFHPLADDFGGKITPASSANCPAGTALASKVTVGGAADFPVCRLTSRITSDVTLTNDHVYLLTQTINVGNGDKQGDPSGNDATLKVEPGTQIYGAAGLQTSMVITRGSQIQVTNGGDSTAGEADLPVIMGAVKATFQ